MARPDAQNVHGRNGVVEYDDPDTGKHVVIMDGMTVETGASEALAIVTVAIVVSCGSCLRRWLLPLADYRHGWSQCAHCGVSLYLPCVYADASAGEDGARVVLPLRGHEFPPAGGR